MEKQENQVYTRKPLTDLEVSRVNEINFNNMLIHLTEKFASPMVLGQYLNMTATFIGISADELNMVANKSFKNDTFPIKGEELIEIYYRVDFSRRDIRKLLSIGDRKITDAVSSQVSFIQEPIFTQAEAMVALRFVRHFTDLSEEVI